jgi:hypothetical protein
LICGQAWWDADRPRPWPWRAGFEHALYEFAR